MKIPVRLAKITLFHGVFASYGDIEASVLNYLYVPIRHFFANSLQTNYGISETSQGSVFSFFFVTE